VAQYVKNKDLLAELIKCKDASIYSMELHGMFAQMIDKFSYKFQYVHPEDREDCKSQAIEDLFMYWNRFDPSKGTNAFAYISQIIKMGYAKGWKKIYPGKFTYGNKLSISYHQIYNL